MFVKPGRRHDDPALPLIVRGTNKRLLSPQAEHVPEITFWHRRVRDGDVVLAEPPGPPPPSQKPSSTQTLRHGFLLQARQHAICCTPMARQTGSENPPTCRHPATQPA
jgi:hypothetical protein